MICPNFLKDGFYLKSIQLKNNYPANYNLGVLYRKLNDLENSEKYLQKAIALQPLNQYACYALGMTYFKGKLFEKGYSKDVDWAKSSVEIICKSILGNFCSFPISLQMFSNISVKSLIARAAHGISLSITAILHISASRSR